MEFATKVLTLDDSLREELVKLEAEGWQLVIGVKPIAVYFVGRTRSPGLGAMGGISVDDSKITVIRPKEKA